MSGIFVSHSSKNRDFVVGAILPMLKAEGWNPWYSDERITAADQWRREIKDGLERCPWFLVVLSPEAVASEWVEVEVDWAMEHRRGRIIPLIYWECRVDDLHLFLRKLQHIRFTENTAADRARVAAELRRVMGASSPAAPATSKVPKTIPLIQEVSSPAESNFTNRHGLEMIWCPPGKFLMGSPESEPGRSSDETQHEVTLTRGFWISRFPVTQEQWKKLMRTNPSHFTKSGRKAPVEAVSWDDAMAFCARLGPEPDGRGYTLPTEAQWEYACRAGTKGRYAHTSLGKMGWYLLNSWFKSHPVGEKQGNPWGFMTCMGMSGNGAWIGMDRIAPRRSRILRVPRRPRIG